MSFVKVLSVLCVVLVLSSCEKTEQQSQSETATNGSFELVADEVLKPVIDSLVQGFMIESPTAKVTVKYVSAGEAVRQLMNHQARAVIIDRFLTPQERSVLAKDSVTLPEFKMAEDGIGVITSVADIGHIGNVEHLTHIRNLFEKAHPSQEDEEKVFPAYPSSIEYVLDSIAGADETGGLVRRFQSTDSLISYVGSEENRIGFVSSCWKHRLEDIEQNKDVGFLAVIPHDLSSQGISEPVMLHIAYIAEKAYPLTTMVMGYTQEPPNTVPRGFFAYCMTAHGQTTFKNFGILPKTQPLRLVPAK